MRTPHILKHNKNNETVHAAVWFDTETNPKRHSKDTIYHELWFGWACYRRRNPDGQWGREHWFRFTTQEDFWKAVISWTRDRVKLWLFCHNTSFDLPVLDVFKSLSRLGFTLTVATLESPPTVLQYRRGTRSIVIVDTLNIWRMPLAGIGKSIGVEKGAMPVKICGVHCWDWYCKQDVRVIMTALILWWEMLIKLDMGGFASTLAAQSMRVFRHKYMKDEIFIDTNSDALELSRSAYHGGRTEAHFIGKQSGEFYLLDINSMYPFVMSNTKVPTKIIGFTRHVTVEDLQKWCVDRCMVSHVEINSRENYAPYREGPKLLFPIGRFETFLSTPELSYALQRGHITRVFSVAVYSGAIAFRDYMLDIWSRRLAAIRAGDTILATQLKTLVNAFYGKWGQSGAVWRKVNDTTDSAIRYWYEIDAETDTVIRWRQFGGIVQRKSDAFESAMSFPAIAAHITAAARMQLYLLMKKAGFDHVYYCDTDSLLVDRSGYERLLDDISDGELGKLKIEGTYNQITIYGAKDYMFDTKIRIKGIRKNALYLGDGRYEQERWSSLRGMLREGIVDRPLTKRIRKWLRREYEKGMVQENGRVLPFHYF